MFFKSMKMKREEEIRQIKKDAAKKVGIAFLAGTALATVATLLLAPKSGKELREDVVKSVENGADKIKQKGEYIAVKAAEVIDSSVEVGKRFKDEVSKKFLKDESQIASEAKELVDTLAEESKEAIEVLDEAVDNLTTH